MFVETKIENILENPITKSPFIILREKLGKRKLTINIGLFEAAQLSDHLEGIVPPRPMALDLFSSLLFSINYRVSGIFIERNLESIFYANVELKRNNSHEKFMIDSRPSDALSIALNENAPVYVHASLFNNF